MEIQQQMANAELIELARSKKRWTAQSLLDISTKALLTCVCRNLQDRTTILDDDEEQNPFKYLPDTLVQRIFDMFSQAQRKESPLVPKESELVLVRMLLNKNVRSYDCNQFYMKTEEFDQAIFNCLLEQCPNLERFTISGSASGFVFGINLRIEIPIERLANWTKLKHLTLMNYLCTDGCLEKISRLFPKLQSLSIEVNGSGVTADGMQSLAKMGNLTTMNAFYSDRAETDKGLELLVDIAGNVPNLRTFEFFIQYKLDADCEFVKLYGRRFPHKKLRIISRISLNKGIEKWPDCLSFENMRVAWLKPDPALVAAACSVPLPMQQLRLACVPSSVMYQVLDTPLGAQLETLDVECSDIYEPLDVDLYRLITCCPNLQMLMLTLDCQAFFQPGTAAKLKPQHFRKMKLLQLREKHRRSNAIVSDFVHMWTAFLLGTECRPKRLFIEVNDHKAQALKRALIENPDCQVLSNLRKAEISFPQNTINPIKEAFQLVQLLVLNAPRLECMYFPSTRDYHDVNKVNIRLKEFIEAIGIKCFLGLRM